MSARMMFFYTILWVTLVEVISMEMVFTMKENDSIPHSLGNIPDEIQNQNLQNVINITSGQERTFSIITQAAKHIFTLNDDGNLYTQVMIDRDTHTGCEFRQDCVITFQVGVLIGTQSFSEITVSVHVEDINDNKPEFPRPVWTLAVMEDVAINTTFRVDNAIDLDMGVGNGIQNYEMVTVSEKFGFTSAKNTEGEFTLELFVKEKLDREVKESYQLLIVSRDGGDPVLTGTLTVDVVVEDKNDHAPEFLQDIYNVSVAEDTSPGEVVVTLSASDRDAGNNAEVFYRIKENQAGFTTINTFFNVDSSSGQLSIKSMLEYREGLFYEFDVEAYDHGEPARVAQSKVLVYVLDAGNNAPTITFSSFSPGNPSLINIAENSLNNSFIAHLTVEDTDSGPSGDVSCSVSDPSFHISSTSATGHIVSVISNLDRETQDQYDIVVTCVDAAPVPLSSSLALHIKVTDKNDNPPVFEGVNRHATVYENADSDTTVLQVSATDLDIGENGIITYRIDDQDKIVIDPSNGIIRVKPFFDRETTPSVTFEVLAVDQGTPPLTGTTTVTLDIGDRNDNAPQFSRMQYTLQVQENMASGTKVGQLSATDLDDGDNKEISFSMRPSSSVPTGIPFIVFSNGEIVTNQELDREVQNRYDFTVIVVDQGSPPLSSSVSVIVNVGDENDNAPVIRFPTESNRTVSILYPNDSVNYVTKILAYDIDSGRNRTLQYSIKDGNKYDMFSIDVNTGVLTVSKQDVPIEADETITMLIEVKDMGTLEQSSTEVLIVELVFSNATRLPLDGGDNKFVVISVIVVVITVVISAGIIAVIFVLRLFDGKKRQMEERSRSDSDCGFDSKPSQYIVKPQEDEESLPSSSGGNRKKKEVSFSIDDRDPLSSYGLRVNNFPEPEKQQNDKVSTVSDYSQRSSKTDTYLENLKLSQMLMAAKAKQNQSQVIKLEERDSHSETSGETTQSDSGRGGSEEDVPSTSPSADDPHTFEILQRPQRTTDLPTQLLSHNLSLNSSRGGNSSPLPPPVPTRTYKTYSSFNVHPSYTSPQYYSPRSSNEVPVLDVASLSWEHYPTHQPAVDFSDVHSYPSQFPNSFKNRDDDDCSTTTSGSYTIYSEDIL